MTTQTMNATDIRPGMQVIERDGALLDVVSVGTERGFVVMLLKSFGPTSHVIARVRKSSLIRVMVTQEA